MLQRCETTTLTARKQCSNSLEWMLRGPQCIVVTPIVGIGLGFPGSASGTSERVKYVLNRVGERELLEFEEDEEDEIE